MNSTKFNIYHEFDQSLFDENTMALSLSLSLSLTIKSGTKKNKNQENNDKKKRTGLIQVKLG